LNFEFIGSLVFYQGELFEQFSLVFYSTEHESRPATRLTFTFHRISSRNT
jgi:hypothetical protein